MTLDEYRFICWVNNQVPSARIIRDLLRERREEKEKKEEEENDNTTTP